MKTLPLKPITLALTTLVAGLLAGTLAPASAAANGNLEDLDAKIVQLSKRGTPLAEVIKLLGEPEKYAWGDQTFQKNNLPETFVACYPKGVDVLVSDGVVAELRSESGGPGFTWRGKLRLGSSLEEVLEVVGQPTETVVGKPVPSPAGDAVLYKDIDGKKGHCYYSRPAQNVRFFFRNYKVIALYVTLDEEEGFMAVKPLTQVGPFQDARFRDLSALDLAGKPELPATLTFNQRTVWPKSLPAGADPGTLLASAKNPGLGIRKLHQEGLTGKGINVAIIDQPLYQDHPEFAGKIAAYEDVGCQSESSMHGPAVTSLLVGNECGTAPEARVYYAAAPSWRGDSAFYAKALDWLVEQNAKLPAQHKIRVVSVSAAPSGPGSPFKKNQGMWDAACARAEKAGMLVLDCSTHHGLLGPCYYDAAAPDDLSKCKPGFPSHPGNRNLPKRLLVPCSPRTTAEEYVKGEYGYQYCGEGGLSWGIPYCAGVLAMGWQARPDLDAAQMRELLFKSAYKTADGSQMLNPPEFIRLVKAAAK